MSLADKLLNLKVSYTNTYETDFKKKKSLIYEDGASVTRIDTYLQCKKGFDDLCALDQNFRQFENLYNADDVDRHFMLLQEETIKEIQETIKHFLYLSSGHLNLQCTLQSIEWLIYKYEVHLHQPEDILIACLPHLESHIFIKFIRLLDFTKKEFSWLKSISESGRTINVETLSGICIKNSYISEMICGWPANILCITGNNKNSCKKLYHIIFSLAVYILDKVVLKGSDKIKKHMSPFGRFMIDGFSSIIIDFMSASALILIYMSHHIDIDKKFLRSCVKKMLSNDVLQNYTCLRMVIDVLSSQNYPLCDKLRTLFRTKMERLDARDKKLIEKILAEVDIGINDVMDVQDSNIKLEDNIIESKNQEISQFAKQEKQSTLIANILTSCQIDWSDVNIELQLVNILTNHVLTWYNATNPKISAKLAIEALTLLRGRPKELRIAYQRGGIVPHLCVALMSPSADVRRATKKLMPKLISDWPRMTVIASISKSVLNSDHQSICFGNAGHILLSEIDAICSEGASSTIMKTALSMINTQTLSLLPSSANIWSLFLKAIAPAYKDVSIHECALSALSAIGSSFSSLQVSHQNAILDAITSDLSSQHQALSQVIVTLTKVHLSLDNFLYLLRDVLQRPMTSSKKKQPKSHGNLSSVTSEEEYIRGEGKYRVVVTLGALNLGSQHLPVNDQIKLIDPLCLIIYKVHRSTSASTDNDSSTINNNEDMIYLLTNLMSAMLIILPPQGTELDHDTRYFLTTAIKIDDLCRCLYIFNDTNLHNLILMVIQKLAKLELGVEQFPLTYFMSWLGQNIVPRDDEHSMNIVNSVLELTLPVFIKVRQNSEQGDNVNVIASFVEDCVDLPKHRVLLLYHLLIKNLSADSNLLWMQLIFMAVIERSTVTNSSPNACLIVPLMNKFHKEERLQAMKKVVRFLAQFISNPSKKRKLCSVEVSNSPMQKKQKIGKGAEMKMGKVNCGNMSEEMEFESLKAHLLLTDKNLSISSLLKTLMTYFVMQVKEYMKDMTDVTSEVLMDFISGMFGSMKMISNCSQTLADAQARNDLSLMIREIIELVGTSLTRSTYLDLVVNLAQQDSDESVQVKSLELLANKLASMANERNFGRMDEEMSQLAAIIMAMCTDIINGSKGEHAWEYSVSCATSIVSLSLLNGERVKPLCDSVYHILLDNVHNNLTQLKPGQIVLINGYLQKYVTADNGSELRRVLEAAVVEAEDCLATKQFNNGVVESALALVHAILAREDSERIGWDLFERLSLALFELTIVEVQLKRLSRASLIYQKNIRIKLSKMHDTDSLMRACTRLFDAGIERESLTHVSGSISLLGCHWNVLQKRVSRWEMAAWQDSEVLWPLVVRLMSVSERGEFATKMDDVRECEELSLKALNQLCCLFDFEQELLAKVANWAQASDVEPSTFLARISMLYRLLHHVSTKTKASGEKTINFIGQSNALPFAAALMTQLASVRSLGKKRTKRRRTHEENTAAIISHSGERLTSECPAQCASAVRAMCLAIHGHLAAEHSANLSLVISEDTTAMIGAVCATLTSMEAYVCTKEEFAASADEFLVPLFAQMATNSRGDDALLTPLCIGLCRYFSELSADVILAVLKSIAAMKEALGGAAFNGTVRSKVSSFLDDCQLHDDETIVELANEI